MIKYKLKKMENRKKEILEKIEDCENRRKRSEYGMVNSIIQNKPVDSEDVKYFNQYTSQIEIYREELRELTEAFEELKGNTK